MNKEDIILRAEQDLLFFGKAVTPGTFTEASPAFHQELAGALLDEGYRKLNVVAPRGHAKSSIIAGIKPLHHLCYGKGGRFIMLVSKTEGHAVKLLQTIKDTLEYSPTFRALYGYWGRHSAKAWKRTEVELVDPRSPEDPVYILCRGADQQMRGLKYINQRPTLVIYDDPEDEKNTRSDDAMANNLDNLLKGVVPGLDRKRGRVIVVGTPIHTKGMVNRLETFPDWKTLKYRALNEREDIEVTESVPEAERYYALWPEMMSVEQLLKERASAEAAGKISWFYSEYQCEVVGDNDQLFKPEYFRFWDGELKRDLNGEAYLSIKSQSLGGKDLVPLPSPKKVAVNLFMGVDPASSTSRQADYSCIFVLAVDQDLNIYCMDYFRQRVRPMQLADTIVSYFRKYRPKKTQIETVGYQEMIRDYLRTHIPEYIPGLEIKNSPRRGKTERLESLQPEFALGKVHLKPEMTVFMDEMLLFPRAQNDDTLDGYFYARKGAYRPYHDVVEKVDESKRARPTQQLDWMVV